MATQQITSRQAVGGLGGGGGVSPEVPLSLTKSGATLTIQRYDNTALSAGNNAEIAIQSAVTPGLTVIASIEANVTFDDGVSGDFTGNLLGTTSGVAYGDELPVFIYLVNKDDSQYEFCLSRNPIMARTPSTVGNIAQKADANADVQYDCLLVTTGEVLSGWIDKPTKLIGALSATKNASEQFTMFNDTVREGFGPMALDYVFGTDWVYPTGQHGTVAGKHIRNGAGVAPTFNLIFYVWKQLPTGEVFLNFKFRSDGGVDGSSGDNTVLVMPLRGVYVGATGGTKDVFQGSGHIFFASDGFQNHPTQFNPNNLPSETAGAVIPFMVGIGGPPLSSWSNGDRMFTGQLQYSAFNSVY